MHVYRRSNRRNKGCAKWSRDPGSVCHIVLGKQWYAKVNGRSLRGFLQTNNYTRDAGVVKTRIASVLSCLFSPFAGTFRPSKRPGKGKKSKFKQKCVPSAEAGHVSFGIQEGIFFFGRERLQVTERRHVTNKEQRRRRTRSGHHEARETSNSWLIDPLGATRCEWKVVPSICSVLCFKLGAWLRPSSHAMLKTRRVKQYTSAEGLLTSARASLASPGGLNCTSFHTAWWWNVSCVVIWIRVADPWSAHTSGIGAAAMRPNQRETDTGKETHGLGACRSSPW